MKFLKLFSLILLLAVPAFADTPQGKPYFSKTIKGIDITVHREKKIYQARAEKIIDVKPEFLWQALIEFPNHPDYLPNLHSMKVEELEKGKVLLVKPTIIMFIFVIDIEMTNTLTVKKGKWVREWKQGKGILKVNTGSWTLTREPGGKTRAVYQQNLYHPLISKGMAQSLISDTVPKLFKAFTKRARELEKDEKKLR